MKRRGRKRKSGARHPNGKLRQPIRVSPCEVAAGMPHRRGVAEPVDPLAESAIGRMYLRGELACEQLLAGQEYARLWQHYVMTIGPPRPIKSGHAGSGVDCGGCLGLVDSDKCHCARDRRKYIEAFAMLRAQNLCNVVGWTAIDDSPYRPGTLELLRIGLWALAQHFGLTKKANRRIAEMHRPNPVLAPPAETS